MKNLIFIIAIVLMAAPLAAQAQSIKVERDRSVDFTKYKTYSWAEGRPASNPEIHRLILVEVERHLQSRGLKKVEAEGDLNITYYASFDENVNTSAVEYVKSTDWNRWGDHNPVYGPKMVALPIARIVLDIVDTSTGNLVWRGSAKDAYTPDQSRGRKRVNRAVEKLLDRFPTFSPE